MNDLEIQHSTMKATWLTTLFTGVMMLCGIYSVYFVYTQTPLFEGARPKLWYYVLTRNTNSRDIDGLFTHDNDVYLANTSRFPAKNVHIVFDGGSEIEINTTLMHRKENLSNYRHLFIFDMIPANSTTRIYFSTKFKNYGRGLSSGEGGPPDIIDQLVSTSYIYGGPSITDIYTEFGSANLVKEKCDRFIMYLPDDYRSDEGKVRNKELRERLIKEGKPELTHGNMYQIAKELNLDVPDLRKTKKDD